MADRMARSRQKRSAGRGYGPDRQQTGPGWMARCCRSRLRAPARRPGHGRSTYGVRLFIDPVLAVACKPKGALCNSHRFGRRTRASIRSEVCRSVLWEITDVLSWSSRMARPDHAHNDHDMARSAEGCVAASLRWSAVFAVTVGCLTPSLLPRTARAATASVWSAQAVPVPSGSHRSTLSAVSCTSSKACTAVGSFKNRTGEFALAERWNGSRWSIQRAAKPAGARGSTLSGVSCATKSTCTAVGSYTDKAKNTWALVERWNGFRWSIQQTPNPAGAARYSSLSGVSCPSKTTCTAVGSYGDLADNTWALVERRDGSTWSIQTTPVLGSPESGESETWFSAVSCASRTDCMAVGGNDLGMEYCDSTLVERFNGARWSIVSSPCDWPMYYTYDNHLNGVSCSAPSACTVVGDSGVEDYGSLPMADRWAGGRWSVVSASELIDIDRTGSAYAVSCISPRACTAVGMTYDGVERPFVYRLTGAKWSMQRTPKSNVTLRGVSCTTTTSCVAIGDNGRRAASMVLQPNPTIVPPHGLG